MNGNEMRYLVVMAAGALFAILTTHIEGFSIFEFVTGAILVGFIMMGITK